MTLIGHAKQLANLKPLFLPEKRRSAIGIIAPEGVGRFKFVETLFSSILPCDQKKLSSSTISIDSIRDLQNWVFAHPVQSQLKVLTIGPAENLSSEAQNALLKLLEEAPDYLVIVLVCETLSELLNTLISRVQWIQLYLLSKAHCEQVWQSLMIDANIYPQLWSLAPGQPGLALKRTTHKFLANLGLINKFISSKPSAFGLLHLQEQFPSDWTDADHMDFWLWLAPQIFQSVPQGSHLANFSISVSNLIENPGVSTNLLIPALWQEAFGS